MRDVDVHMLWPPSRVAGTRTRRWQRAGMRTHQPVRCCSTCSTKHTALMRTSTALRVRCCCGGETTSETNSIVYTPCNCLVVVTCCWPTGLVQLGSKEAGKAVRCMQEAAIARAHAATAGAAYGKTTPSTNQARARYEQVCPSCERKSWGLVSGMRPHRYATTHTTTHAMTPRLRRSLTASWRLPPAAPSTPARPTCSTCPRTPQNPHPPSVW